MALSFALIQLILDASNANCVIDPPYVKSISNNPLKPTITGLLLPLI
jgi:hypothetical protein